MPLTRFSQNYYSIVLDRPVELTVVIGLPLQTTEGLLPSCITVVHCTEMIILEGHNLSLSIH
ncbi:MAG: hypothetical protein ACNYZG_05840 [Gammaproteobacteria bacterium]